MDATTLGDVTDLSNSVEDLDGVGWGDPFLDSYVVRTTFALRRKPLRDLTDEDLRLGIGQQVGLPYLVPLAIARLENDPLLDVHYFEGDLLKNVLNVPRDYWSKNPDQALAVTRIAAEALQSLPELPPEWHDAVWPGLQEALERFEGRREARRWLRADQGKAAPRLQSAAAAAAGLAGQDFASS